MGTDIDKYINPIHLKPKSITKYKKQFAESCPNAIILDDFFQPQALEILQSIINNKISFTKMHALYHKEGYADQTFTKVIKNVPKWAFDKIDDKRRFLKRSQFTLPNNKERLSKINQKLPGLLPLFNAL